MASCFSALWTSRPTSQSRRPSFMSLVPWQRWILQGSCCCLSQFLRRRNPDNSRRYAPGGPTPRARLLLGSRGACLMPAEHLAHRPPLVGNGVAHDAVCLTPFVVFRQVLGDGHALGRDEEQAVAVLVLLHLVAGADPASILRLGGRIRVEVAGTEGLSHLLDVTGESRHDRLGDGAVRVERGAGLLRVLAGVCPPLVNVCGRGLVHETSDPTTASRPHRWQPD